MSHVVLSGITSDVPIEFITDLGGPVVAINNKVIVTGGPGVTTDGVMNQLIINVSGSGFTWNQVTPLVPVNPISLVAENGYICGGVGTTTFTLPLAPAIGDTYKIFSYSSKFQINQNANQLIQIGSASTAIGVLGFLISNSIGDALTLTYMGNNTFQNESMQGTLTLN